LTHYAYLDEDHIDVLLRQLLHVRRDFLARAAPLGCQEQQVQSND
jgi:hypothetical protein